MKNKFIIPVIIYALIFVMFLFFRETIEKYMSGDILLILGASSAIILAIFVLISKKGTDTNK